MNDFILFKLFSINNAIIKKLLIGFENNMFQAPIFMKTL
ncbi:hypothetical protein Bint_0221 [Brachyspira intermedia PWS/A]|uniref:Uncharacterized protein n=1 Tax=Brachyspira intermedia (strain ATCC 51140 / PWS/A) TaxID=1045858 RepID=G0EQF0_BRAIP|nr:hypothetical protein Bint_0221 [Brachyspira intermedia PWS/A]